MKIALVNKPVEVSDLIQINRITATNMIKNDLVR